MKLKFKKLKEGAAAPSLGSEHAAGFDLCVCEDVTVGVGEAVLLPTGIAVEVPEGHVGLLALRSSTPRKKGLLSPHGMGIIDADYRGELMVQVCSFTGGEVLIEAGERIAQLVIVPARVVVDAAGAARLIKGVEEVSSLGETVRGGGGFGSTS